MERNDYYNNVQVLFEIVKSLRGRETTFLSKNKCIRCIKVHKLNYLTQNMKAFNFWKTDYNIYYSLARLYGMPMFTFNLKKRKGQQAIFNEEFGKYLVGYDFGMDFDAHKGGFDVVYNDTKKIKEFFDEYKVPYELKFSGSGFHININHQHLPKVNNKHEFLKNAVDRLKTIFNCKSLDLGVYDIRRVWKAPYSYDVKTGNIALPLTDDQFNNFSKDMVKPENVLKLTLLNRGLLEREGSKEGVTRFLIDFIVDDGDELGGA